MFEDRALEGDLEDMQEMIDRGADINATMANGWTALIAAGADVNQETGKGVTALTLAKGRGYSDIVELLEKAGAKERTR